MRHPFPSRQFAQAVAVDRPALRVPSQMDRAVHRAVTSGVTIRGRPLYQLHVMQTGAVA
jgi:hypothetical protein